MITGNHHLVEKICILGLSALALMALGQKNKVFWAMLYDIDVLKIFRPFFTASPQIIGVKVLAQIPLLGYFIDHLASHI